MKLEDRKAAIAAYKERKTARGVFAIRCVPTGQVWIGESRHLDTQKNGLWFSLRQGTNRNAALQTAWRRHGEDAFVFEALERFGDDVSAYLLPSTLRQRAAHWRAKLDGLPV